MLDRSLRCHFNITLFEICTIFLESDKVVFPRPRPPEKVTISMNLGGISGTRRTIILYTLLMVGVITLLFLWLCNAWTLTNYFYILLGVKRVLEPPLWRVFERMTSTIYPPPLKYFVTISKLIESRFFSWPPPFSDDVILYDVFYFDGIPY